MNSFNFNDAFSFKLATQQEDTAAKINVFVGVFVGVLLRWVYSIAVDVIRNNAPWCFGSWVTILIRLAVALGVTLFVFSGYWQKVKDQPQRQFTKDDVRELVDYAGEKLGTLMDERIVHAKSEISSLVQEKVEYFKREIDSFFIERQRDLARERRRLFINVAIAVLASLSLGFVSWLYHQYLGGGLDVFAIFRIVLASLMGGYTAYLAVKLLRRWLSMSEHKKDTLFLVSRYWGVLRPESIFGTVILVCLMAVLAGLLLFPDQIAHLTGSEKWLKALRDAYPMLRR